MFSTERPNTRAGIHSRGESVHHTTPQLRLKLAIRSHTGPVWQVAWAHPKFGQILASCSYDGKVIIWKEQPGHGPSVGGWTKIKEHTLHKASGACLSLCLHQLTLTLRQSTLCRGHLMSWAPSLPVHPLTAPSPFSLSKVRLSVPHGPTHQSIDLRWFLSF